MPSRAKAQAKARHAAATLRLSGVAREVLRRNLTYVSAVKLQRIEACLAATVRDAVPGDYLEAGVALGGSAIVIASHLEGPRHFHGYDVFGVIPEPGDADPHEVHERYDVIASGRSRGIGGGSITGTATTSYRRSSRLSARSGSRSMASACSSIAVSSRTH